MCRAHRRGWPGERPYGFGDLPVAISGEYYTDERGSLWHPLSSAYELWVMWTWGNYKAMHDGRGVDRGCDLRTALALVHENSAVRP